MNRPFETRIRRPWRFLLRDLGLHPIRDREECQRLWPVLRAFRVRDLRDARWYYAHLKRRAPDALVLKPQPGPHLYLGRDKRGRWTR